MYKNAELEEGFLYTHEFKELCLKHAQCAEGLSKREGSIAGNTDILPKQILYEAII